MSSLNKSSKWFEMRVWIREGKNLENKKLIGSNSPFVQVTLGNEIKRTLSKSSLDNPIWDEKLIFRFNKIEELPDNCLLQVKDENTLLPNSLLGEYKYNLSKDMFTNYHQNPNNIIQDGSINLQNCTQGELDFQLLFKYYNEFEPQLEKESKQETLEQVNEAENQLKFEKMDMNETHILPTIHLKDKPRIIEKEVEYNKPIEIKETIIHKEKPIIIEQPIIKEKHEQYFEETKLEQKKQETIKESIHEKDVGNLDQQALENLREQRKQEFMDITPNVEYQKQQVQLDTEYRENPTQINEKEVVYQQPIEIEKTTIEQVKPTIHEDIKVEKEHVYQKVAPEFQQANVQFVQVNEQEMRQQ